MYKNTAGVKTNYSVKTANSQRRYTMGVYLAFDFIDFIGHLIKNN